MKTTHFGQVAFFLLCTLPFSVQAGDNSARWSDQQLDAYSDMQQLISPSAKSPAQKVRELFPGQTSYSLSDIKTTLNPAKPSSPIKLIEDHTQNNPKQEGTFSTEETLR